MSQKLESATLRIVTKKDKHSVADVTGLIEALDGMICASIWPAITFSNSLDQELNQARKILCKELADGIILSKFLQPFNQGLDAIIRAFKRDIEERTKHVDESEILQLINDYFHIDSTDSLSVAMQIGRNAYLRTALRKYNPELYNKIFSFAEVTKLEHRSPLAIEVTILIGSALTVPFILTFGLMRALHENAKREQELKIREAEAQIKAEEAKQWNIKTEILETMRDAIKEQKAKGQIINVPEGVLVAAANLGTPSIAELSGSPLIGEIKLG